jgi:hypothetical protein
MSLYYRNFEPAFENMIGASKIAYFDFVPLPSCVIDRRRQEISLWREQV